MVSQGSKPGLRVRINQGAFPSILVNGMGLVHPLFLGEVRMTSESSEAERYGQLQFDSTIGKSQVPLGVPIWIRLGQSVTLPMFTYSGQCSPQMEWIENEKHGSPSS